MLGNSAADGEKHEKPLRIIIRSRFETNIFKVCVKVLVSTPALQSEPLSG
jgi:hypothetical protein